MSKRLNLDSFLATLPSPPLHRSLRDGLTKVAVREDTRQTNVVAAAAAAATDGAATDGAGSCKTFRFSF